MSKCPLIVAEAKAILKIASEIDLVGVQELANLSEKETQAWSDLVESARDRIKGWELEV